VTVTRFETRGGARVYQMPVETFPGHGAHVEYLFQRGELRIANLEDVTRENNPVIRYEARRGA
jgi:hypothetical protein